MELLCEKALPLLPFVRGSLHSRLIALKGRGGGVCAQLSAVCFSHPQVGLPWSAVGKGLCGRASAVCLPHPLDWARRWWHSPLYRTFPFTVNEAPSEHDVSSIAIGRRMAFLDRRDAQIRHWWKACVRRRNDICPYVPANLRAKRLIYRHGN